jgi:hypothetical protein
MLELAQRAGVVAELSPQSSRWLVRVSGSRLSCHRHCITPPAGDDIRRRQVWHQVPLVLLNCCSTLTSASSSAIACSTRCRGPFGECRRRIRQRRPGGSRRAACRRNKVQIGETVLLSGPGGSRVAGPAQGIAVRGDTPARATRISTPVRREERIGRLAARLQQAATISGSWRCSPSGALRRSAPHRRPGRAARRRGARFRATRTGLSGGLARLRAAPP